MQTKDIAIIGGGIAGLTLAISLRGSRFKCHIFEKESELKSDDSAIIMFPNALRVFKKYGFMREVMDAGGAINQIYMKKDDGKIFAQTHPRYQLPPVCLHRKDLYATLIKHAEATFYTNHTLESFQNLPDGRVMLSFKNGASKIFDALIGADGLHSLVRQSIIGDGKPIFRGYNIWCGIAEANAGSGYASESYGKGKRVGIVPIQKGKCSWWATMNESFMAEDAPENTKQKLLDAFGNWHHPISELIEKTERISKHSLCDRVTVTGWTKGNCTLIGDAAHPTTPNLGQGGCLAVEGAYILGEVIRKYGITDSTFQRYETLQFERAKSVVQASRQLGEMGQLENSIGVFFRNLILRFTPSRTTLQVVDKFFLYDVTAMNI